MMLLKLKGKYITQSGLKTTEEAEMATFTPEKVTTDTAIHPVSAAEGKVKSQAGRMARLLARVSRWSDQYAEYEMERGVWRKLAL